MQRSSSEPDLLGPDGKPLRQRPSALARWKRASSTARRWALALVGFVAGLALLLTNLDTITSFFNTDDTAAVRSALAAQVEIDPPLYGSHTDGNVRPPMEAYIRSFVFPEDCPGTFSATHLLEMVRDRANPAKPDEYFFLDSTFRAELESFRARVRQYSITGNWPEP